MMVLPCYYDYVFPTFNLPNATKVELGIVEYLYSQHTLDKDREFFNKSPEYKNTKQIFNSYIDGYPPCCGFDINDTLGMAAFSEFLTIFKHSVFFGKKQFSKKYIYHIGVSPEFSNFLGYKKNGHKLKNEYFWKNISTEVLNDCQNGDAIIVLDYTLENEVHEFEFDVLNKILYDSEIPKTQIYLIVNAFGIKEKYESLYTEQKRQVQVRNFPLLWNRSSFNYNNQSYLYSIEMFQHLKSIIRDYHFLLPCRRFRPHRQAVLAMMATDNLLQLGNWSCLDPVSKGYPATEMLNCSLNLGLNPDKEKIEKLLQELPKNLFNEQGKGFYQLAYFEDKEDNKSSYFYIVTETFLDTQCLTLSEKTCKPLANFHPFVLFAFPGALKLLRSLGFKTFSPFIDESYDEETNTSLRVQKAYNEVKKLCQMDKNTLHDWYYSMEDILIHNYKHMINFYKTDNTCLDVLTELHQKLKS